MPVKDTARINQSITVKGNPVKHYEDFLINDSNNFQGCVNRLDKKIDFYSVFYSIIALFSGAFGFFIHYFRFGIKNIDIYYYSHLILYAIIYIFGVFMHALITKLAGDKLSYIYLKNAARKYFLGKYEIDQALILDYKKYENFLKTGNYNFINVIIFYLIHFSIGVALLYFIFKSFIAIGNNVLTLLLCFFISLLFSYIFYFWHKNSIESVVSFDETKNSFYENKK